jgi:hypothetical protein
MFTKTAEENNYTYFKCDSCGKIKHMKQRVIKKVAFTKVTSKSEYSLIFNVYNVQLCLDCLKEEK